MQKKHRNGGASERPVEDEIAHLRGLDLRGLRARWQSIFGRQAPSHLTRHLLFSVIAYRLQADRWDGISDMNDPAVVRRYLNFFDEVWQTSMQESQMRQMLM